MYHNVRVDIFNNEVADVLDGSIATGFIQRPDFSRRIICRRIIESRKQGWIPKVDIVGVAREKVREPVLGILGSTRRVPVQVTASKARCQRTIT